MAGRFQRAREEGRRQGVRTVLEIQLRHRFGPLSPRVAERLRGASTHDLETWVDKVLDATTLDDVFETTPSAAPNLTEGASP